jgi:hypothetical protein
MKKIFISAGLAAVSAAGFETVFAAGPDVLSPKDWNVSGTLRGFYDDNYAAGGNQKGSAGFEVSPTISLNVPLQQTEIGLRYTYGLYYYQQREDLGVDAFDQSHQLELWLDHAFNERWRANVSDSFAVGQEPELLQPNQGVGQAVPYRIQGDNIANHANLTLNTEWTRQFSTRLHYGNNFYDYNNSGTSVIGPLGFQSLSGSGASYAGLLNRIEQNVSLDFQWTIEPETMAFIGYNFSLVNFTGDEPIAVFNYLDASFTPQSLVYKSDSRDSMSHTAYVGVNHQFTANVSGMMRGGVTYTDNYNDPLQETTSVSPYADMSVSYTYMPGSYLQVGLTHEINATDVVQLGNDGSLTQNQESTVIYADVNHRFTPKLLGTVIGRFSSSTFDGGAHNNSSDEAYSLGINLNYQINRHFSTDLGYNYDDLVSGIAGRSYDRNRVYIGLTANY